MAAEPVRVAKELQPRRLGEMAPVRGPMRPLLPEEQSFAVRHHAEDPSIDRRNSSDAIWRPVGVERIHLGRFMTRIDESHRNEIIALDELQRVGIKYVSPFAVRGKDRQNRSSHSLGKD